MSLSRFLLSSAAIAIFVLTPAGAHAQSGWKTVCNDGTSTKATGNNACDGHGGIHKARTAVARRTPTKSTKSEPARVQQAGTPAPKPRYEEHRGWRWGRHHDADRRDEKHRRVRCRDGKYDKVTGKGKEVCKHHGGVAH